MKKITFSFLLLSFILISCTANDGQDGLNSLLLTSIEPAGGNCPTGGVRIDSGLDSNSNGVLDTDEIASTNYICSGINSLVNIADELAGGTCALGGIRIETGQDTNGNGTLDEEEIQITRFLCNNAGGGFDEQIRLSFAYISVGYTTDSTSGFNGSLVGIELPDFNKNFWSGIDSIVFVARIASDIPPSGNSNPNNYAFAELFDLTNGVRIENSLISSNFQDLPNVATPPPFIYSDNIFEYLPNETISLSTILWTENEGDRVRFYIPAYLFLYRSN